LLQPCSRLTWITRLPFNRQSIDAEYYSYVDVSGNAANSASVLWIHLLPLYFSFVFGRCRDRISALKRSANCKIFIALALQVSVGYITLRYATTASNNAPLCAYTFISNVVLEWLALLSRNREV
jgi:hypothetical protein